MASPMAGQSKEISWFGNCQSTRLGPGNHHFPRSVRRTFFGGLGGFPRALYKKSGLAERLLSASPDAACQTHEIPLTRLRLWIMPACGGLVFSAGWPSVVLALAAGSVRVPD